MNNNIHKRAYFIRYSYIENMETNLSSFEKKLCDNGIDVKWIDNNDQLVDFLRSDSVCSKRINNKMCFDMPIPNGLIDSSSNVIKSVSLDDLENNIDSAEVLITKADFGIVETGSVVLFNHQSCHCFNKIEHLIIVLNINDLLIKNEDLGIMLSLYDFDTLNGKQHVINVISKPYDVITSNNYGYDQEELYTTQKVKVTLLFYNNGITDILNNEKIRESLYCINCGRCSEVCPVYNINHEQSPIDLIKNNCFSKSQKDSSIFSACMLCGNCDNVCPVMISFSNLLLAEMETIATNDPEGAWHEFGKNSCKRQKINKYNGKILKFILLKRLYKKNRTLYNYYFTQPEEFFNIQNEKENAE